MPKLPIPRGWNKRVQSAILQAISLGRHCFFSIVGRMANSSATVDRVVAENERLQHDVESSTTVGRMITEPPRTFPQASKTAIAGPVVTAKGPDHVWHIDLTAVPTSGGFWTAWTPFSVFPSWPFGWWIAVAVSLERKPRRRKRKQSRVAASCVIRAGIIDISLSTHSLAGQEFYFSNNTL